MTVVDPFGGIGGCGYEACTRGVKFIGCELEPKFVALAAENVALWKRLYSHWPEWVEPVILQGDSRRLCELVGTAAGIVSSPPYCGDSGKADKTGHERAERRAEEKGLRQGLGCFKTSEAYGSEPGQLGAMPPGNFAAVLSSPPYAETDIGAKEKRDGGKRLEQLIRARENGNELGRESLRVLEKGLNANTNLNASARRLRHDSRPARRTSRGRRGQRDFESAV